MWLIYNLPLLYSTCMSGKCSLIFYSLMKLSSVCNFLFHAWLSKLIWFYGRAGGKLLLTDSISLVVKFVLLFPFPFLLGIVLMSLIFLGH